MKPETPDLYRIRLSDGQEFGPATLDQVLDWGRAGRIPTDSLLVPADGSPARSVLTEPHLRAIIQAPPTISSGPVPTPDEDGGVAAMIPYRNPPALMAYYCGLFSLLPFIGLVLGILGFVLGIIGLRRRAKDPRVKGSVHAWIGILMGGPLAVVWGLLFALYIWSRFIYVV